MMNQRIGNVGLLNLMNATEESIKGIEQIENVGMVLYRHGNAQLLSKLNIGNIGSSVEIPEGYHFLNGMLNLDVPFLLSIVEPVKLVVNGIVIISRDVQANQLNADQLSLIVNGNIYCPAHLTGLVGQLLTQGSGAVEAYHTAPPRVENGKFTLTNSFLQALEEPMYLVVNGLLSFSQDLNMETFHEKIEKLEVNGKISLYENQESYLYKKIASLTSCHLEIIPEGYELVAKPLRLNARSIRRFINKKLFTKKSIILDADVSRELLAKSIAMIHSSSVIICSEEVEDLIYERISLLDTEILSYENSFVLIEGEEVWSNDQFQAFEQPINLVVNGQLILDKDVSGEVLQSKVAALDILGEIVVRDQKVKAALQQVIRVNTGSIAEEGKKEQISFLQNIGELSL
ncbi:hypothetical protein [Neobacillus sp. FSL H8-0543]|uniref:hypothetical protein n=1 Tax=Neobacillus sp. FSL H8-0543 TaxID=2954672 RepID=UPI0031593DF8